MEDKRIKILQIIRKNKWLVNVLRYGLTILSVIVAFWIYGVLTEFFGSGLPPFILFYPVVIIVALLCGFRPGILATFLSAAIAGTWIISPLGEFSFESSIDQIIVMIFTISGLMISTVTEFYRQNQKNAEEELQRSRERFRALAENSPDIIIRLDRDLRYVYINSVVIEKTGQSPEYYIGKTYEEAGIPEKIATLWKESNLKALETGEIQHQEFEYFTTDDKRFIESTVVPEFNGSGKIESLLVLSRDITKRKNTEKECEVLINELKRSNEELQQFAYVSSHDMQEPLRTIASFTQLLQRRYEGKLDKDADEFMDYIVEAAVRMKAQIEGLLEYSRVGTKGEEFKPVDMNEIINQTIQSLSTSIKEIDANIKVDELPVVMGDENQLQRVFQNLFSNAIKFKKQEKPLKIHIYANKDIYNNEYVFGVQDNGIGIEEQYTERIFTIFQRLHTRDVYKGTGIGLSIVKRVIERHGGRVWVESEFGMGSTFYFTIPVYDAKVN